MMTKPNINPIVPSEKDLADPIEYLAYYVSRDTLEAWHNTARVFQDEHSRITCEKAMVVKIQAGLK